MLGNKMMPDHKPIPEADLREMRERCDAATKGKWRWQKFGDYYYLTGQYGCRPIIIAELDGGLSNRNSEMDLLIPLTPDHPDSKFLEYSRTDIPRLLDEVDRLREGLREQETHELDCTKIQVGPSYRSMACDCNYAEDNARIDALLGEGGE
ncbi:hypothetical protein LCGC14_2135500 [marine sediment metagenome]|uniref:Uncharacterized protein n=1 Tax=marine sediment metagenome TaxID=412755 RepID=A0A0F9GWB3_9ZZZZ